MIKKILHKPIFIKLFSWEYWPFNVVYAPMFFYWFWLGLKARNVFFFNTSNPSIKNGGFLQESKKEIYDLMPPGTYPKTLFFRPGAAFVEIKQGLQAQKMSYPLLAKPDIGLRGMGVKKLESDQELLEYAAASKVDFLVQDFVPFENEVGIFYYRYPGEARGQISGIVGKEFLAVTGDGNSSIETLLRKEPRFILQLATLQKSHADILKDVPGENAVHLLVPYGNHCRGAKFVDITHLADAGLTDTIDKVCRQVPDFYYGRLDIRYNTWEELKSGVNFSIIELNGAGSEPTHIYDPGHSIFFAWKEIIRHWIILFRISQQNHHQRNLPYMTFSDGLQMLKDNSKYVKLIST